MRELIPISLYQGHRTHGIPTAVKRLELITSLLGSRHPFQHWADASVVFAPKIVGNYELHLLVHSASSNGPWGKCIIQDMATAGVSAVADGILPRWLSSMLGKTRLYSSFGIWYRRERMSEVRSVGNVDC